MSNDNIADNSTDGKGVDAGNSPPVTANVVSIDSGQRKKIGSVLQIVVIRQYLEGFAWTEFRRLLEPRGSFGVALTQPVGVHGYRKAIGGVRFERDFATKGAESVQFWGELPAPSDAELARWQSAWAGVEWAQPQLLKDIPHDAPDEILEASKELFNTSRKSTLEAERNRRLWEFRDARNMLAMVQVRHKTEDERGKSYEDWTFWDDLQWRNQWPEKLPLFNAHLLKEAAGDVWLHEGPKAAHFCQWLAGKDREAQELVCTHPWGDRIRSATHIGWPGGAFHADHVDWSPLRIRGGGGNLIVLADNDIEGKRAVRQISRILGRRMFAVYFTGKWRLGFDMFDAFDESHLPSSPSTPDGDRFKWPELADLIEPATWIAYSRGKKSPPRFNEAAREDYVYLRDIDRFLECGNPSTLLSPDKLNNRARYLCDDGVKEVAKLVIENQIEPVATWTYQPFENWRDPDSGLILDGGRKKFNRYRPPSLRAYPSPPRYGYDTAITARHDEFMKAKIAPWLDFMEYLVPDERERRELLRWCATLIGRPKVRMPYGVLMISEAQGTGKSTLSDRVLAPLVGGGNVSWPRNEDINGRFNTWAMCKRLVVMREIYQSQSWKVYHELKELITDPMITVEEKNQTAETVPNFCHVYASSNHKNALKIDDQDRRWFVPRVTETPWPTERFRDFHHWLGGEGLSVILFWARTYGRYVSGAERAPTTLQKTQIIEDSMSGSAKAIFEWLRDIAEVPPTEDERAQWKPPVVSFSAVARFARRFGNIPDAEVRKVLRTVGFRGSDDESVGLNWGRMKIGDDRSTKHTVWGTPQFWEVARGAESQKSVVDEHYQRPPLTEM